MQGPRVGEKMLPVGKNRGGNLDRHEDNHLARPRAIGADDIESSPPMSSPTGKRCSSGGSL